MWLANLLRRFALFYLKLIVLLAFVCVFAQMLAGLWRSVHVSGPSSFVILLVLATASIVAYFIRKGYRPRPERQARRGAERTPMLPPSGGAQW